MRNRMKKREHIFSIIKTDLARLCPPTFGNFLLWYFLPKGSTFPYIVWFRLMHVCKKRKILKYSIGLIVYLFYRHFGYKFGISADTNMEVGCGLKIVHGFGVVLNCEKIGKNFTVFQNTTLGSDMENRVPIVLDNVTIYTGSIVVGNICLRDNCIVGANSFVNRDVEENSIVVGSPAKKIEKISL